MEPTRPLRLGIVTNLPGMMDRRARGIAAHLERADAEILVAPGPRRVAAQAPRWDAAYVIDPGKRGMAAAVVCRALGKPTIVEIGDPQAQLFRAQGRGSATVAIGATFDAAAVRYASGVAFRGSDLAQTLPPKMPWRFVPDGVDTDRFRALGSAGARASLGLPSDDLVVGVVGSITWSERRRWAYGLDLVEALADLRDYPIRVLIVGGGDGLEHLRRRGSELGVSERLLLTGRQPHPEIPRLLSAMDVCVSTQSNDPIGRGRTTAKLPEYLACDRFVLATDVGTASKILPTEMLLPYSDSLDSAHPARLAQRLAELCRRRDELHGGAGTRPLALEHFAYRRVAERVRDFLDAILERA
ncbi:MAG TPA: glycosyltransferase [Solirubrobacteraceae bacterium]|jgi:glycosyltransferase involved in cell wall biosynthesis|nr:glycosyltransferase [Solirubrobacteraceae bacterium]